MKFRRHLPRPVDWLAWFRRNPTLQREGPEIRRALKNLAIFLGAAAIGYLVAALFLFRAPIFAQSSTVPRVIGLPVDSARAVLKRAELNGREGEKVPHPSALPGRVIWQDPPADVVVTSGTTVDLSLSGGPQKVLIPDVAGYDEATARLLIQSAGLTATTETAQTAAPKGVVVNSRPPAGSALNPGRPVVLVVSAGAPTITVPNVMGLTLEEAKAKIDSVGLRTGTSLMRSTTDAVPGTVIDQRPPGGTLGAPGTAVDLVIARKVQ
ncbi:MAG: PASTA domain-containing protein [Gemmatimonadetes bacterium]|nr:PASTA domain-containing protein [Gemmatimonadota bacterium]